MAIRSDYKRRKPQRLRDVASFGRRTPRFDFVQIREEIRASQHEAKFDNILALDALYSSSKITSQMK